MCGGPACAPGGGRCAGLRIVIEDCGRQADPDAIKGRDLDDIRPGGLGVHIIREVMDQAVYEKRPAGGMRLTLVKWLDTGKDATGGHSHDPARLDDEGSGRQHTNGAAGEVQGGGHD
jgi:hypothetical protein